MIRMANLAGKGRITEALVPSETALLTAYCKQLSRPTPAGDTDDPAILMDRPGKGYEEKFDSFDLVQLAHFARVCRGARSMAEAGRHLFSVSRTAKDNPNDTDRVKRSLTRFGLRWENVSGKSL